MPELKTRKRRFLAAALMVSASGCAVPTNLHPRSWSPWATQPSTGAEQTEVIAARATAPILSRPTVAAPPAAALGLPSVANAAVTAGPNESPTDRPRFRDATPAARAAAFKMASPSDAFADSAARHSFPEIASLPEMPSLDDLPPSDPVPETLPAPALEELAAPEGDDALTTPLPIAGAQEGLQVIDLSSALGMAGGNAWIIQLARQRTVEAHAELKKARALWLPNLQFGVGWNKHEGRIQATPGDVIETSRNSLFVGGGATYGAPVAGGSGGPFRLFADLALADAFFEPKVAGRALSAQRAGVSVAMNRALRDAGIAYVDLVEAAGEVADARAATAAATELYTLAKTFADAGAGAQADVDRAATEQARLTQISHDTSRRFRVRSATLSRRLRLDPRYTLQPADQVVVPLELIGEPDLDSMIATGLSRRPEVIEHSHRIAGLCLEVKKAQVEPWLPSVTMATSAGTFGGGLGGSLDNRAGRSDIDLQAIWELNSLGVGVSANRSRANSRLAQQRIELADLRDQITAEVVQAYENVINYRSQITTSEAALGFAESSYARNLQRVRADEGLPIELLQAIRARAQGLRDRTQAVANYNRSQLELLYATGQLRP